MMPGHLQFRADEEAIAGRAGRKASRVCERDQILKKCSPGLTMNMKGDKVEDAGEKTREGGTGPVTSGHPVIRHAQETQ